ncbi:MAG: GntR family transcriptional regulator [Armatimonadetes bacterium]|nr:GntR family transcriptional regulator [Armatimonadota bacterium]
MLPLHQYHLEESAADSIAEVIRKMIAAGELKPGDRINQRTIAQRLDVTTTPLREALSKLEQDGTVQRLAGTGVFVRAYTRNEVRQIYLLREVNEGLAARLCAENASDRQIERLESMVVELNSARESGNLERVRAVEMAFHERIAQLCGAPIVEAQIKKMMFVRSTIMSLSGPISREYDFAPEADHGEIVAAIRERDGSKAEAAVRKHIANGYRSYLAWLDYMEDES